MEETLKTVRSIHRSCVLVCVAVLLVATFADKRTQYVDAINELDQLLQIPFNEFTSDYASTGSFLLDFIPRLNEQIESLNSSSKINIQYQPSSDMWFRIRDEIYEYDFLSLKLAELNALLVSDDASKPIRYASADVDAVRSQLKTIIDSGVLSAQESYELQFKDAFEGITIPPGRTPTLSPDPTGALSKIDFTVLLEPGERQFVAPIRIFEISNSSFKDWFLNEMIGAPQVENLDIESALFPKLKIVWDEVKNLRPSLAMSVLEEGRAASSKGPQLNLFGTLFNGLWAVIGGPLAICSSLLYLLVHIRFLKRLISANLKEAQENKVFKSFPWIGLYDDIIGKGLTTTSLLVLPVVSIGLLLYQFQEDSWLVSAVGIPSAVLALISGILSMRILISIHEHGLPRA